MEPSNAIMGMMAGNVLQTGKQTTLSFFYLICIIYSKSSKAEPYIFEFSRRGVGDNVFIGVQEEIHKFLLDTENTRTCGLMCLSTENCNCFQLSWIQTNQWECSIRSKYFNVTSDGPDTDEYCIRCPDGYHLQLGTRCYKYSGHDVILTHDQANQVHVHVMM